MGAKKKPAKRIDKKPKGTQTKTMSANARPNWRTHLRAAKTCLVLHGDWEGARTHWQLAWALTGGNPELKLLGETLLALAPTGK
jgi:hypothetical protein